MPDLSTGRYPLSFHYCFHLLSFLTPPTRTPPRSGQWIVWVFRPSTRNVKRALFLLHLPYKLVATIIPLNNPWKPVLVFPGVEESKTRQRRALSTGPFTVFHPRREILPRLQSIKNTTGVETVVFSLAKPIDVVKTAGEFFAGAAVCIQISLISFD